MNRDRGICWSCLIGGSGLILLAVATVVPLLQRGCRSCRR